MMGFFLINYILPYVFLFSSLPFMKLAISAVQVHYVDLKCTDDGNYTRQSVYETNLKFALANLSSQASKRGFYNFTVGVGSDQVYALYLCRGDVNSEVCQLCIDTSSNIVTTEEYCPNYKVAVIWYKECMLRYSNSAIFAIGVGTEGNWVSWDSNYNVSNPREFSKVLSDTMNGLIKKAVSTATTPAYFQTGEAKLTDFETLYCLVQCTPDITGFECRRCLLGALAFYPNCCTVGREWAFIFGESCQMVYSSSPFYNIPSSSPPPPIAAPTDPFQVNTTLHGGQPTLADPNKNSRGNGHRRRIITIVSLVLSAILIMMVALVGFLYAQKRRRIGQEQRMFEDGEDQDVESQLFLSIPLDVILTATQDFSEENKIGEGGFGPVYKGTLAEGKEIAVKKLSRSSCQGLQEFKNEVSLIARLQHRNLVRLLGYCMEENEFILVYEYMPNKSLDFSLFDSTRAAKLDWSRRFSIIDGIARGLLYLHEDSRLRIIHRDLKASNILLDHEMNPKISDFGMARIVEINQSVANTSRVVGTYGYIAPEYAIHGLFSVKSDVFSFGVLLLEIISGRKNGSTFDHSGKNLIIFAWEEWKSCNELVLVDPSIMETCEASKVLKCLHIGLLCVQEDPTDRPTMSSVVIMLRSGTTTLPRPKQPAFLFKGHTSNSSPAQEVKAGVSNNNVLTFSKVAPR